MDESKLIMDSPLNLQSLMFPISMKRPLKIDTRV